jgi:putative transport protein
VLGAGDVVAIAGRRSTLVQAFEQGQSGLHEVDDKELLELPGDFVDVIVTNEAIDGRAFLDLGQDEVMRGVFLKGITRSGNPLVISPGTTVQRGDVLTIVGSQADIERAVQEVGVADRATDATDMLVVALTIAAGALLGLPTLNIRGLDVGLSVPVGVLLGGLVCGWLRMVKPRYFARIPGPTLWVFESLGLTSFIAIVGLSAGPNFVQGLKAGGPSLLLASALTLSIPLVVGVLAGRWLFKLHAGIVLGVCAGSCTATPALAAVQEVAKSTVPSMGYGVAYAVGNVLLALWGTLIVRLLA